MTFPVINFGNDNSDPPRERVERYRKGTELTSSRMNQAVDAINRMMKGANLPKQVGRINQYPMVYMAQSDAGKGDDKVKAIRVARSKNAGQGLRSSRDVGTLGDYYPVDVTREFRKLAYKVYSGDILVPVRGGAGELYLAPTIGNGSFDDPDVTWKYTGEHQETAFTEPEWLMRSPPDPDKDGITITIVTGISYYPGGDQILYQYSRDFTFNSEGVLESISTETRTTVEVPVDCETP